MEVKQSESGTNIGTNIQITQSQAVRHAKKRIGYSHRAFLEDAAAGILVGNLPIGFTGSYGTREEVKISP